MIRYACHTINVGNAPRSRNAQLEVQTGWTYDGRRLTKMHVPDWLPIKCGHVAQEGRGPDPMCAGCENSPWKEGSTNA